MKKRVLGWILASVLAVGTLSGCGAGNETGNGAASETAGGNTADSNDTAGDNSTTAGDNNSAGAESSANATTAEGIAEQIYFPELPTGSEEAEVYVEAIPGLSEDFIKGVDISILPAEEASGVKYYDAEGNEQDLFKILADAGVNYIRVRVWNDPFDENGNGYGGGNCNAETAAELGRRAAQYGMKLNVDFHYSDFWADPNKQMCPKAWEGLTGSEKADALYEYTKESLTTILDAGADVGMVQIGNEINNGLAGETSQRVMINLLKKGSEAVREIAAQYNRDIKIAVHFTNVDDPQGIRNKATWLTNAKLDYDIFGFSYYYYWHSDMENMKAVLTETAETTGKDVMILETAWPWTGDDGDENGNSVNAEDARDDSYQASVQSQATMTRDVMAAASEVGGLGVFYWEPAWVPVGHDYTTNSVIWEKYGSGWASSYASDYDPNDAGKYYGGSSWDNQAFFDFDGHVLPSLDVFKYVNYGATCETKLDFLAQVDMIAAIASPLEVPETVMGVMNNRAENREVPVTWDEAALAAISTDEAGEYVVKGAAEDGTETTLTIKVKNINLLQNGGFDEDDMSMWVVGDGSTSTDVQTKPSDTKSAPNAYHFWDTTDQHFTLEQTVTGLSAGTYAASAYFQGGDVGDGAEVYLYVQYGDEIFRSEPVTLDGWCNWKWPVVNGIEVSDDATLTVGISVTCASGGWGTIDDIELYKTK